MTATFFLCGRSLHGLGPAWFEVLDRLVQLRGLQETSRLLGIAARTVEIWPWPARGVSRFRKWS